MPRSFLATATGCTKLGGRDTSSWCVSGIRPRLRSAGSFWRASFACWCMARNRCGPRRARLFHPRQCCVQRVRLARFLLDRADEARRLGTRWSAS